MPTRIIRDGINSSQRVNLLSPEAEVFYRRLLLHVDDFGCCETHPGLLRAALFPLRLDRVRESHITTWLDACAKAGLVGLYQTAGRDLLQVLNFRQQVRSKPKHPLPTAEQMNSFVHGCFQLIADAKHMISDAQHVISNDHLGGVEGVVGVGVGGGSQRDCPASESEVVTYARSIGLSDDEAKKFFDHFEANGWRQGGRARIRSWPAALRNWQRRAAEFGKNSSGSAAASTWADHESPTGEALQKLIKN